MWPVTQGGACEWGDGGARLWKCATDWLAAAIKGPDVPTDLFLTTEQSAAR